MRCLARLALLAMLSTLACASENFPMAPLQLPDAVPYTPMSGGEGREIALTFPFSDARADRERCGKHKSSLTRNWRGLRCEGEDPGLWIAMQLSSQLSAAGFEVVTNRPTTSPHTLRIEGTLERLFAETLIGAWVSRFECDLQLSLVASNAAGLSAERTFFVKRSFPILLGVTHATVVERCTRAMMVEVVTAISDLANRYDPIASRRLDAPGPVVRTRRSNRWVSLAGISSPAE